MNDESRPASPERIDPDTTARDVAELKRRWERQIATATAAADQRERDVKAASEHLDALVTDHRRLKAYAESLRESFEHYKDSA